MRLTPPTCGTCFCLTPSRKRQPACTRASVECTDPGARRARVATVLSWLWSHGGAIGRARLRPLDGLIGARVTCRFPLVEINAQAGAVVRIHIPRAHLGTARENRLLRLCKGHPLLHAEVRAGEVEVE